VKQFLTVLIALALFGLMACEGPAGPAGAKGDTGTAGQNAGFVYFDGFKDSLKCAACHNPETDTTYYIAGKALEWEESTHGSGTAWEENRSSCAECHTTEGFMLKQAGKTVTDIPDATPPGCFACHSPHSKGDFSLRTIAPVTLASNITGVAATTFDLGKGNLCVACHHPRTVSPMPDPTKTASTDTIKITNNRWYAHYGVQGQILTGAGAFQFTDAAAYGKTTAHSSGVVATEGCTACHMQNFSPANAFGGKIGAHTMEMRYTPEGASTSVLLVEGCMKCHSSITKKTSGSYSNIDDFNYNGKKAAFDANMDTLKTLLVAKGWINTSDGIVATTASPLVIIPASRAGALFNYMLLLHDGSKGIHNPAYANDILRASIAEIRK
jgi:hypothetical protein